MSCPVLLYMVSLNLVMVVGTVHGIREAHLWTRSRACIAPNSGKGNVRGVCWTLWGKFSSLYKREIQQVVPFLPLHIAICMGYLEGEWPS